MIGSYSCILFQLFIAFDHFKSENFFFVEFRLKLIILMKQYYAETFTLPGMDAILCMNFLGKITISIPWENHRLLLIEILGIILIETKTESGEEPKRDINIS